MDVAYKMLPLQAQQQQQQQQEHSMLSADDDDNMSANSQNSHCQDSLPSNAGVPLRNEPSDVVITQPTISVRDMIKRYDFVAQQHASQLNAPAGGIAPAAAGPLKRHSSHHTLYAPKTPTSTMLNGISKFGSQTNVRQFVTQASDVERFSKLNKELRPNWVKKSSSIDQEFNTGTSSESAPYCNGSGSTGYCAGPGSSSVKFSNSGMVLGVSGLMTGSGSGMALGGNYAAGNNSAAYGMSNTNVGNAIGGSTGSATNIDHLSYSQRSRRGRVVQSESKEFGNTFRTGTPYNRSRMQSPDYSEDAPQQPPQTSYQSRTTISKTTNGVRITIDIFFDQDSPNMNPLDVVGSRIETEIPHSRILNEFQEQSSALSSGPNSERF